MQKKYSPSMRNLLKRSSFVSLAVVLFSHLVFAFEPKALPLWRDFLRLPDNRWIWLKKVGGVDEHKTKIILGKKIKNSKGKLINKVVWSEEYEEKHDALWDYAYFLKIKAGQYFSDINHDGRLEVAIMPYDSGNWMIRRALIYTVKSDRLELIRVQPNYNLETDEDVYKEQ